MAEHHIRCRFWPHCRLHLGQEKPRLFSDENRLEMAALYREGWQMTEIADAFDTSSSVVTRILNDRRNNERR